RELAGLCVTRLEPDAARAGHARGAAAGRGPLHHGRDVVHAGDGGVAGHLASAVLPAFEHAVLQVRADPRSGAAAALAELGAVAIVDDLHRGVALVPARQLGVSVAEAAILAEAFRI